MCRNHKCGVLFNDRPQNDPLAQKCWFKKQLISKAKSFLKSNFDLNQRYKIPLNSEF